ncbi:hypothetical protein GW17_00054284, partial [Ensete ventricosum]
WICNLHKQPCHVVYTDYRPTPLQHYVFPIGGSGLYLVVDENEQFKEDNFMKLQETFTKQKAQADGNKSGGKVSGRIAKGGTASAGSDIYKIVKQDSVNSCGQTNRRLEHLMYIMLDVASAALQLVTWNFSRRECEQHAMSMSKLDFNGQEEKDVVEQVFRNAVLCLNEEDRTLPAIELMLPLLKRGIAVHHSGLLPIIKELVELLFQEGLVKALFATETLGLEVAQLEKKIMSEITRPEKVLMYLVPGRLVKVRDGGTDWGWGVVVNVVKKPPTASSTLPPALVSARSSSAYIVDTLLHCSPGSSENGSRPKPCPPRPGEKGEMHVVKIDRQRSIEEEKGKKKKKKKKRRRSTSRRPSGDSARGSPASRRRPCCPSAVAACGFAAGSFLPTLERIRGDDMGIKDPEFVSLVNQIEEIEQKVFAHPLHKLQKFRDELKNRSRVLKMLGHIDADGVLQLKGRAACLIDTGDELLVTELMFMYNEFNSLFSMQGASFAEVIEMTDIFEGSIIRLARRLNEFLNQVKLDASTFSFGL